jgi:hypothetical protein
MANLNRKWRRSFWLVLSIASALSMWRYVNHIWSVGQPAGFSDLYARWWGTHELLLHHRDPYSVGVSREIQTVIYGAPLPVPDPGAPEEWGGGFAYPIYVVFLLWPTVWLPFHVVQTIFSYVLPTLTLISFPLWLYALNWHPTTFESSTIVIFTLGSFPFLQGLKLQNLSLLVAFLVALAIACLAAGRFDAAGISIALSSIKPQFVFVLILWLAIWTAHDWHRRQKLAWSFLISETLLVLGGETLSPGWITRCLGVARAYKQYTYGHSLLDVWLTPRIGAFAALVIISLVLILCWHCRSSEARSSRFFLASSFALAATLIIIPTLEPHAQLLLLPGFLFLLKYLQQIRHFSGKVRLALISAFCLPAWAWTAALSMTLASILMPNDTLRRYWILPLYTSPLIPFGVVVVLAALLRLENRNPNPFGA